MRALILATFFLVFYPYVVTAGPIRCFDRAIDWMTSHGWLKPRLPGLRKKLGGKHVVFLTAEELKKTSPDVEMYFPYMEDDLKPLSREQRVWAIENAFQVEVRGGVPGYVISTEDYDHMFHGVQKLEHSAESDVLPPREVKAVEAHNSQDPEEIKPIEMDVRRGEEPLIGGRVDNPEIVRELKEAEPDISTRRSRRR